MKFGRFHGQLLCVLGLIYLIAQGVVSMRHTLPHEGQTRASEARSGSSFHYLPIFGMVGGVTLLAGMVLILTQKKKSLAEELATGEDGKVNPENIHKR